MVDYCTLVIIAAKTYLVDPKNSTRSSVIEAHQNMNFLAWWFNGGLMVLLWCVYGVLMVF